MEIYLLRHGDAADRLTGGYPRDEDRPLTPAGRTEARDAARALARLGEVPDLVLTSSLVRAAQTAALVAEELRLARDPVVCDALAPGGSCEAIVAALLAAGHPASALLVGHMPDLGELAGWLVWGQPDTALTFRTGGLCRITTLDRPVPGTGDLRWLLAPKVLRRLGAG
jgi:phosphohistidine phosphatase